MTDQGRQSNASLVVALSDLAEQKNNILLRFNDLETLFKRSQLALGDFSKSTLHEYRYFARALIDFELSTEDSKKREALERCKHSLSCAYNDIVDYLHDFCVKCADEARSLNRKRWRVVLDGHGYAEFLRIKQQVVELIAGTRGQRAGRFEKYVEFASCEKVDSPLNVMITLASAWPTILYELEAHQTAEDHVELESKWLQEAKGALANSLINSTEFPKFEVHYQPKCERNSDSKWRVVGAEALIRLKASSESDLLYPDSFLPSIFSAGLGLKVDSHVLREALKFRSELLSDSLIDSHFKISVNFMPRDMYHGHFSSEINRQLASFDGALGVAIEIAENWLTGGDESGSNEVEKILAKVRYELELLDPRVEIQIDDFGTGTTRLRYLADLDHVKCIKVDKNLVDLLRTRRSEEAIRLVDGILSMAKSLKIKVVVEGVETVEQVNQLVESAQVETIQGYIFSKPLPKEQFRDFLSKAKEEGLDYIRS